MQIITIDNSNRFLFEGLMPAEIFASLDMPGYFALGAIGEDEEGKFAAGVLVFEVTEGMIGEESVIGTQLHWIYVAEAFRRLGAADALVKEMLGVLRKSEIPFVCCDLPMADEQDLLCAYLEAWGFLFRHIEKYECSVPLGVFVQKPFFSKKIKNQVRSLSAFQEGTVIRNIREFQQMPMVATDMEAALSRCDFDVSCAIFEKSVIEAMFLVRKRADESLEILFLRSRKKNPKHIMDLLLFAAEQAVKKYPLDTQIHIICRIEAAANLLVHFLPEEKPLLIRRGLLDVLGETEEDNDEKADELTEDAEKGV